MKQEYLKDHIAGWMAKSRATLKDCLILMGVSDNSGISVANRAYYASFYTLIALLATVDFKPEPEEDEATLAVFEREFVTTGKISGETADTIRKLYELQMDVDFVRVEKVGREEAKEAIEMSGRVYNAISTYLFTQGLLEEAK